MQKTVALSYKKNHKKREIKKQIPLIIAIKTVSNNKFNQRNERSPH